MRYTLGFGLAGLILLAAFGLIVANAPPLVIDDRDVSHGAKSHTDRYAVPTEADLRTLVRFVRALEDFKPASTDEADERDAKAPTAIRKACERILEMEEDAKSEAHRFAKRHLLKLRIDGLDSDTKPKQRVRLVNDVRDFLTDAKLTTDDADLALALGTAIKGLGPEDLAEEVYTSLGKLLAASKDTDVARDGEFLLGSARRMKLVGQPIELSGTTVEGKAFDLASLKGKVVLVDFWTTWCRSCVAEMPRLKRYYEAYHDAGFEIVGVSCDDERDELDQFLKRRKLPWLTLHDADRGADHPAAQRYGVAAFPTQFLVDQTGKVIATDVRAADLRKWLRKLLGPGSVTPGHELNIGDRKYPVFHTEEVIERLTDAGIELFEADKAHTGEHLREHLPKQRREIKLAPAATEPVSDQELYRKVLDNVFVVGELYRPEDSDEFETALATAFALTADGILSTSAHVFEDDLHVEAAIVMDSRGRVFPIEELLALDKEADTCLFRIAAKGLTPLALADDAVPGSRVRVVSHPGDIFFFFSAGHVGNYFRDDDSVTWMNITADFGEGSSGAPVLDDRGNVIGQVSRTSTLFSSDVSAETRQSRRAIGATLRLGSATRHVPHRTPRRLRPNQHAHADNETLITSDPQMVFKMCVPVDSLRRLTRP